MWKISFFTKTKLFTWDTGVARLRITYNFFKSSVFQAHCI